MRRHALATALAALTLAFSAAHATTPAGPSADTQAPADPGQPVTRALDARPAKAPPPAPEADLSGLPVRADIKPPEPASHQSGYIFDSDGVNCSLYPARCRR